MGARGVGPHRRACATSPARRSASSPRWPPPTPRCSAPSTTSPGPRASWSRRCRPTAPRCSTPATRGWRRWPPAPRPRSLTFGAARRRAGRGRRARRRAAAAFRLCRRGATPRSRSACAGVHQVDNALGGRGRRARVRRCRSTRWRPGLAAAALSPWRMELARRAVGRSGAQRRLQRQPHVDGRRARRRWPRCRPRRRTAVLGLMAELGERSRRRARGDRRAGRRARHPA